MSPYVLNLDMDVYVQIALRTNDSDVSNSHHVDHPGIVYVDAYDFGYLILSAMIDWWITNLAHGYSYKYALE